MVHKAACDVMHGKGLKMLTLAQVKACNASQKLLNEIRQIIYSLYREKEIT